LKDDAAIIGLRPASCSRVGSRGIAAGDGKIARANRVVWTGRRRLPVSRRFSKLAGRPAGRCHHRPPPRRIALSISAEEYWERHGYRDNDDRRPGRAAICAVRARTCTVLMFPPRPRQTASSLHERKSTPDNISTSHRQPAASIQSPLPDQALTHQAQDRRMDTRVGEQITQSR
jgi:hypothetical protein